MELHEKLINRALEIGFAGAAVMKSADLVVVPAYRMFCEENLCGCYNKLPACPPVCGTVEEMREKFLRFENALILRTEMPSGEVDPKSAKLWHNDMSGVLIEELPSFGITEHLLMSAGPWKGNSCMSAYCVDAQKMADSVGMLCWAHDGMDRFFSLILF